MFNKYNRVYTAQFEPSVGILQVHVTCELGLRPIENAIVQVYDMRDLSTLLIQLSTDASGKTEEIELPAPPIEYSMAPSQFQPYSEYAMRITAAGLKTVEIYGTQMLPGIRSIQPVSMPLAEANEDNIVTITIGPHGLWGIYPPHIEETEINTNPNIIAQEPVIIPNSITVHNGLPSNPNAMNYCIDYKDYIKNVASGELYATWPESTLYANILALLSFTLNRVYTKWYPNKGYDFTITASTAFDNLWIYGRNIYENISLIVDVIFNNYLSKPNIIQPILTQTCVGTIFICTNMMERWSSKFYGDQGYEPIEILHSFYDESLYENSSNEIAGVPFTWTSEDLSIGSSGESVMQMQTLLNMISIVYPIIPRTEANGIYQQSTLEAVTTFQESFHLPVTGIIDSSVWYNISLLYLSLTHSIKRCSLALPIR